MDAFIKNALFLSQDQTKIWVLLGISMAMSHVVASLTNVTPSDDEKYFNYSYIFTGAVRFNFIVSKDLLSGDDKLRVWLA